MTACRPATTLLVGLLLCFADGSPVDAQGSFIPIQIRDAQANAARLGITLGVSQGIAALPPTAGQSFVYEFEPEIETFTRGANLLGPTSFRSPLTIGRGKLSLRIASSYFEIANTQQPIAYQIAGENGPGSPQVGLETSAKVGLVNVTCSIGPSESVELSVNVPIAVVEARANQLVVSGASSSGALAGFPTSLDALDRNLSNGSFASRAASIDRAEILNEGTSTGLGRVSVSGKAQFVRSQYADVAASMEVFMQNPDDNQFAGTNSYALLPRLITAINLSDAAKLHVDVGYNQDTKFSELSGLVWNTGASWANPGLTFDAGVGGFLFNKDIEWTPAVISRGESSPGVPDPPFVAVGDNTVGTNYINLLFGAKVKLAGDSVLSGAVSVPLNTQGIRPIAIGSLAFEMYF